MKIADFYYDLPKELIAQFPEKVRDRSNLFVLWRSSGRMEHRKFFQIADYLQEGDGLVINDTKVRPSRLLGRKETGGKADVLLLEKISGPVANGKGFAEEWKGLIQTSRPMKPKTRLSFNDGLSARILSRKDEIYRMIFHYRIPLEKAIERIGFVPLPPYIKREVPEEFNREDRERYQTIYASEKGAVAAPTAGLHFTEALLAKIRRKGVEIIPLTLHIGFGTFQPIRVENIEDHQMHSEWYRLSRESAERINGIKDKGHNIYAVGTTVVRTLEFLANEEGRVTEGEGKNNLFIYPGYIFRIIDGLITNFHLPGSTLLMLVCAFAGRDRIFKAYHEAIQRKYRFYSYGDAMLIL